MKNLIEAFKGMKVERMADNNQNHSIIGPTYTHDQLTPKLSTKNRIFFVIKNKSSQ